MGYDATRQHVSIVYSQGGTRGTHCGPLPPAPFHRDFIRLGEGAPTHVRAHPLSTDGRLTGNWTSYDSPRLRVMLAEPPQPPNTQSLTLNNSGDTCEIWYFDPRSSACCGCGWFQTITLLCASSQLSPQRKATKKVEDTTFSVFSTATAPIFFFFHQQHCCSFPVLPKVSLCSTSRKVQGCRGWCSVTRVSLESLAPLHPPFIRWASSASFSAGAPSTPSCVLFLLQLISTVPFSLTSL